MNRVFIAILIIVPVFLSCNRFRADNEKTVLARVQDEYLYKSDIKGAIPKNIPARDSLTMARSLVNKWVEKTMLLKKANENLSREDLNFEEQLEKYRNSLVIYKYETSLVRQQIDTTIREEEIKNYYKENKSNFRLKNGLIKIHYILLPLDYENTSKARRIFFNEDNTISIESYCKENNLSYFLEDTWMYLSEVKNYLPLNIEKTSDIKYKEKELKDSNYQYFIKILESRSTNDIKPLSLVKNDIRNIIVNQRKTRFIKKLHDDLVSKGFDKNEIEIY